MEAAGSSIKSVVKVNVFLADMKDFADMNEVYEQVFLTLAIGDVNFRRSETQNLREAVLP